MVLCLYLLCAAAGSFLKLDLLRLIPEKPRSPVVRRATMPASVGHSTLTDDVSRVHFCSVVSWATRKAYCKESYCANTQSLPLVDQA